MLVEHFLNPPNAAAGALGAMAFQYLARRV